MERPQATEQQNRPQGVGVFTQEEKTIVGKDQSTPSDSQHSTVRVFERPLRGSGFPTSLVVGVVILVALIIVAIVVF